MPNGACFHEVQMRVARITTAHEYVHNVVNMKLSFFERQIPRCGGEDLAHRPLGEFGHTGVAGGGPPITGMRGQQPRRPQLVRIPQRLWLLAGQRHQSPVAASRDRAREKAGRMPRRVRRAYQLSRRRPTRSENSACARQLLDRRGCGRRAQFASHKSSKREPL